MKTITLPWQFNVKDYMLPFLGSTKRFKIAVIHRRGRKTRMALNQQICRSQLKKGVYYFVLPTYKQAKQVIWDELIKDHLPMEIVDKKNDSELAIYYKNGSIQRFVGSEDPDKHRGVNAIDWVFDEYSEQSPRMWVEIAQPILRENGGTATFTFTPRGRNHAWELLQKAKQNPAEWFTTVIPATETGVFSNEELEASRKATPQALFEQEYLCSFTSDAGQFFRRAQDNVREIEDRFQGSHSYVLGVDLAKYQDFTVITPFDLTSFEVLPQERFNQVDWVLQKARIEAASLRYGNALIRVDATGVGDPVVEDLMARNLPVEPFKFTQQSKRNLLNNLALYLEQDKIKLPNDPELIQELNGFQYILNKDTGKIDVESVSEHDDRVMSLALAVWAAPMNPQKKDLNYLSPNIQIADEFSAFGGV